MGDDDAVVTTTDLFDKLFLLADADTSGGIDADEFGALFRMIRVISGESDFSSKSLAMTAAETEAKVHAIFNGMDKDGSGTVEPPSSRSGSSPRSCRASGPNSLRSSRGGTPS